MRSQGQLAAVVGLITIETAQGGPSTVGSCDSFNAGNAADFCIDIGITKEGNGKAGAGDVELIGRRLQDDEGAVVFEECLSGP